MQCIIAVLGVNKEEYLAIRADLESQFTGKGLDIPFFVQLPADYVGIEVVWLEEPKDATNMPTEDFKIMKMMAGVQ